MTATEPDTWGIQQDWVDAYDQPHRVPDETVAVLREAIGAPPDDLDRHAPVVTRPGRPLGLVDHRARSRSSARTAPVVPSETSCPRTSRWATTGSPPATARAGG